MRKTNTIGRLKKNYGECRKSCKDVGLWEATAVKIGTEAGAKDSDW